MNRTEKLATVAKAAHDMESPEFDYSAEYFMQAIMAGEIRPEWNGSVWSFVESASGAVLYTAVESIYAH